MITLFIIKDLNFIPIKVNEKAKVVCVENTIHNLK